MKRNNLKVRRRRHALGLSVPQLSEISGLACGTIDFLEQGRRTGNFLTRLKLARALHIPPSELFENAEISAILELALAVTEEKKESPGA